MKIFKFGGASVNSVDRIKKLGDILRSYTGEKILVVVSAMGKTTNALEKVAEAYYAGNRELAVSLFTQIKNYHLDLVNHLLVTGARPCEETLSGFFIEAEWLLYDKPVRGFDYYYDQIVCVGELLSTTLISHYLKESGVSNAWVDVRDIIRTDNNFRDAAVNWGHTATMVSTKITPLFEKNNLVITQGFIGATDENESTTLGREGSDFSGAVFAHLMNAENQTIWKDVPGVMNADPKQFPEALLISELNYREVIEMAYYGAQVIHPKTIKPLQNKNIPLLVKCFMDPDLPGTLIHHKPVKALPPVIVIKENQVMMELTARDFSFVEEKPVNKLLEFFSDIKLKPNLTQNTAISMICVLDDRPDKIEKLAHEASSLFHVHVVQNLTLLTIRHFTKEIFEKLAGNRKILLQQLTTETIQALLQ